MEVPTGANTSEPVHSCSQKHSRDSPKGGHSHVHRRVSGHTERAHTVARQPDQGRGPDKCQQRREARHKRPPHETLLTSNKWAREPGTGWPSGRGCQAGQRDALAHAVLASVLSGREHTEEGSGLLLRAREVLDKLLLTSDEDGGTGDGGSHRGLACLRTVVTWTPTRALSGLRVERACGHATPAPEWKLSPQQALPHGAPYFPAWIPSQVDESFTRILSLLTPASW